jgi:hypothetical protein
LAAISSLQGERHDKSQGRGNLCRFRPRENQAGCACGRRRRAFSLSVVSRCCPGYNIIRDIFL